MDKELVAQCIWWGNESDTEISCTVYSHLCCETVAWDVLATVARSLDSLAVCRGMMAYVDTVPAPCWPCSNIWPQTDRHVSKE